MNKNLRLVFLPLLFLALTSCGNQSQLPSTPTGSKNSSVQEIGTGGQLVTIQSDNVLAAGYNATTLVMTVQFKNGALYEYYGVPADLWTSFVAAQPHPWSQVGYPRLVQGGIPYKRIG